MEGCALGTGVSSAPSKYFLAALVAHFRLMGGRKGAFCDTQGGYLRSLSIISSRSTISSDLRRELS